MRTTRMQRIAVAATLAALIPTVGRAASTGYDEAWEQLKRLSGTWESQLVGSEGRHNVISYHVTSAGSVVLEEFLGKTPEGVRAMATAYHRNVDDLVATHYCGAGNQPRMRAASWDPATRVLRFDFWDVTNLPDPQAHYTTNIELFFQDDDHAELRFRGKTDGRQEDWQVHRLHRLTHRAFERDETGS